MKGLFDRFRNTQQGNFVTVVSGLPRSGTSMMMKMLAAGGLDPITDHVREADADNPKGYYEFERVKKLPDGDIAWVEHAQGKSVKVITALLEHLPNDYHYKVIFMRRKMEEILASQKKMLIRSGKPTDKVSDEKLAEMYAKHLAKIETWIRAHPNVEVLYVDYNDLLANPEAYPQRINQFLEGRLNAGKMADVVDPRLYRQRR